MKTKNLKLTADILNHNEMRNLKGGEYEGKRVKRYKDSDGTKTKIKEKDL